MIAAVVMAALVGAYSLGNGLENGLELWSAHAASDKAVPPTTSVAAPMATSSPMPAAALPDMSAIVARNGSSVVNISISGKVKNQGLADIPGLDPNDPFYEFFRHFGIPQQRGERQVRGQGSGFILREDGLILTNAHVIDGADEVTVKMIDKREFKAKVLGADKATDVAVLKIDARNLPTVKIGSSTRTRVGEWVLAIGSPYGFENSATAGIISAKSRSLPADNYVPFIQTDVAVNPGNSGGPLFNMAGEVVGINSQIYSRTGGYQGLSFAIPIEVAMSIQDQIVKHGKVQRGRLGISIQEVNQSLADSFGLSKPVGALVSSVESGGPAAKAGLEPGDVILSLNGTEIQTSGELPPLVANIRPGESARLKVWRKGSVRDIEVKVGALKEEKEPVAESKDVAGGRLGVAVRPLSAEERRQFDGRGGLVVQNASGAAARAGIRPGDVILSVNGEPVGSVDQLRGLVAKAGKRVALLIQRDEARLFVPVELN
ncbi:DegQ family serine endoprotease [Propionivibrio limicola]|uniref:DegQ family serine endoprotease n=1 Tax=Propionivibrio limicola TaxID=167645 RepID=UPI001FE3DECE|nr:DegQ family serine endoprotease [Propionivibrio limicola]